MIMTFTMFYCLWIINILSSPPNSYYLKHPISASARDSPVLATGMMIIYSIGLYYILHMIWYSLTVLTTATLYWEKTKNHQIHNLILTLEFQNRSLKGLHHLVTVEILVLHTETGRFDPVMTTTSDSKSGSIIYVIILAFDPEFPLPSDQLDAKSV